LHPTRARARLGSLVELLEDPSPSVWACVAAEFGRLGRAARPGLRRAERDARPRVRLRARRLRLCASRAQAARRLARFAAGGPLELERALWLLGRFVEPEFDVRPHVVALDAMGAELSRRIEHLPPGKARARHLGLYLGQELGFRGVPSGSRTLEDALLHRAIVRKRGLPLTLSALYAGVGRRAGLDCRLVALPGRVILRVNGADGALFLDAFAGGSALEVPAILAYLAKHGPGFQPSLLDGTDDRSLIARQLRNLQAACRSLALSFEVERLDWVLAALDQRAER
jgi:hypothetical protein